jgi:hypothetical protein
MPAYEIDLYTGTVPLRDGSQTNTQFSDNVGDLLAYIPPLVDDINASNVWVNGVNVAVQALADEAATSESNAAASAVAAANSANFKGEWSSLTGALNKPAQVLHNGAYWQLLNNLANVAASEPGITADWAFSSGTRWRTPYTASATMVANSQNTIIATSGAAYMTLPASMAVNDFIVLHNAKSSTQTVRLMNNGYAIRGRRGSVTSSDNLIMGLGDTIHLVCVSPGNLEAV